MSTGEVGDEAGRCPGTISGHHCFHPSRQMVITPAIDPPEGGWPQLQECRHCPQTRWRKVEIIYDYGSKP